MAKFHPRAQTEGNDDGLKEKMIAVNRVTKVVKGGKNMSFAALVVVGDAASGVVGYGSGKAKEVPQAIRKGIEAAKKNLFKINLTQTTIPHQVLGRYGSGMVLLKPAPEGTGVIAGGAVRAVMTSAGVQNVLTKSLGTANPHNVIKATSTPLPQTMPANPTTPLDPNKLASILHGDAQVGDEGVVTVTIDRSDTIVIDGIRVSPEANISTNVQFKPLSSSGSTAAVGPDFSMESSEVMPVVTLMRSQGWFQGCLYNQETDEYPQLYFDHMLKVGDAYALAQEVRRGLDLTDAD